MEDDSRSLEGLQKPSREVIELINEMKMLLETICLNPKIAKPHMLRVAEIKKEIQRAGFPIEWKILIDPLNPTKPQAEITIFLPKKNMTPTEQKSYDAWFSMANNLPPLE
jgi:hypothetical protein